MALETQTLQPINIAREQTAIDDAIGELKGPVRSFIPVNGEALEMRILDTKQLPPGVFERCRMFDDEGYPEFSSQLDMRRSAIRAQSVAAAIRERSEEEGTPMSIDGRLLQLFIDTTSAQAVMVEAARQYYVEKRDGTLTEARATWLKNVLDTAQGEIYSELDPNIAQIALDMINASIRGESYDGEVILSMDTRQAWHDFLHKKFEDKFERVYEEFDDEQEIIGQRLVDMTRAFLSECDFPMARNRDDRDGWDVEYVGDKSGFHVESSVKRVICGSRKKPLTQLEFEKLMLHEVVHHALTAENGSKIGYKALQVGLPGFNEPEEGGGILFETFWSGEDPIELGRDHFRYAATAYAEGVYDGVKHSEQETFDFINDLMERAGVHDEAELYRHVLRPFRGMPDGCRMRSNATYLAGKIGVMHDIEAQFRAGIPVKDTFEMHTAAKINVLDPKQINLVREAKRTAA